MQSKTKPTPAAEAAAEAYPDWQCDVETRWCYDAFIQGYTACLQHLSEQGAEFDLPAFDRTFSELESDGYSRYEIAHTIAREQHAQSQAVIQTLKESNRQAISEYSLAHEHVKKYVEQIAALKADHANALEMLTKERVRLQAELSRERDIWHDLHNGLNAINARYAKALERILNEGNMAAQGHWDATDKMKVIAYEALGREDK